MGIPFDRLPPELYQLRVRLDEQLIASVPDSVPPEVVGRSQEAERAFLARLLASRSAGPPALGSRPTVVLPRGVEPNAERDPVHAALARLSTHSRHAVIAASGHEILLFEPSAVIQAIADVVKSVRERTPLPPR